MDERDNGRMPQRTQQRLPPRRIYTPENQFDLDRSRIPSGMTYRWIRLKVGGMEDQQNQIISEINGWKAVPSERHPELSGLRAEKGRAIVRGDQMLCELPTQYYEESRKLDEFKAQNQLETTIARYSTEGRRTGGVRGGVHRTMAPIDGEAIE
jgi:hypothetical protein